MSKRKLIVNVEHELIALGMSTGLLAKRPDELIEYNYRDTRAAIEKARLPLLALGMYEQAEQAVDVADDFRKRGEYEAASDVVYFTYRELMRRSGTEARYEKKSRGLSDDGAINVQDDTPEDLLDEIQPDAYSGHFMKAVSEQERDLVFAVEDALHTLRRSILLSRLKKEEDLAAAFAAMREKVVAAERPLAGLGVYRTLMEMLAEVEGKLLHGEWSHEDDEEIIMAAELLADRCGLTAMRQQEFAAKRRPRN